MTRHFLEQDGSGTNRTPRPRRAISSHLQAGDNSYRRFDYSDPDCRAVLWRHPTRPADGHCLQEV
jgi:hypothetical protein